MARTKASEKSKKNDLGSQIIDPRPYDFLDSPCEEVQENDTPTPELISQTKLFTNLYRRVDDYMSPKLSSYHKLSMHHTVPGKGKKKKKKSIVKTLLEEENLNFEMFVKRIQERCPWMPKCVPRRDIRTIALVANEIGWDKLLRNKKFIIHKPSPLFEPFCGSNAKFEPWRKAIIQNKQFENTNGLLILKNAFASVYSNYLAVIKQGAYKAMANKDLAAFTGFNKALFEENGRGVVALIGLKTKVVEELFEKYTKMTVKNQRKFKGDVMSYWAKNLPELEKSKICKDFQNIFPSLFIQIRKVQKTFEKPEL